MEPKKAVEIRRDVKVRELWLALSDLSSYYLDNPDAIPTEDLDLFVAISKHSAVQSKLTEEQDESL